MDRHSHPEPRMPMIKQFSENGPVGVLKPCCTTQTDRTRASTGSHRLSSQHAPIRGIAGTDSPYERGQLGEQVRTTLLNASSSLLTQTGHKPGGNRTAQQSDVCYP